jgi:hypothetical protein
MTRYVLGFMVWGSLVSLIRKKRPKWQAGKLNGVGGHVEEGEPPRNAMAREFFEETGVKTSPDLWEYDGRMLFPDAEVVLYHMNWVGNRPKLECKTDELPIWIHMDKGEGKYDLAGDMLPNLPMLLGHMRARISDPKNHPALTFVYPGAHTE